MSLETDEEILSLLPSSLKHEYPLIAWSVRGILEYGKTKGSKSHANLTLHFTLQATHRKKGRSFVIYRREIYRLLNAPKEAFEQIALELPCFMGFRATEVGTWRIEHIDFQHGETLVLDSKKHTLLPVPLNVHTANLVMRVIGNRNEGYVLRNRSPAWRGRKEPIRAKAVWHIWKKWAYALNLYPTPNDYSPLVGRRFLARLYIEKLGLEHIVTLSRIMRHSHPMQTLAYVDKITFAEDVERDYDDFQRQVLSDMLKVKTT